MSMTAEARKLTTVHDLIRMIQNFSSDNERSNSVQNRWLCQALQPAYDMLVQVGNGKLRDETLAAVNAFRASEIEKELERKRRDIEALERDLKNVRAA